MKIKDNLMLSYYDSKNNNYVLRITIISNIAWTFFAYYDQSLFHFYVKGRDLLICQMNRSDIFDMRYFHTGQQLSVKLEEKTFSSFNSFTDERTI